MKKIAKILSVVLCLAMVLSFASVAFAAEGAAATISFADTANRTVMNDNQQVWQQNGITVTNDIGESTTAIKDYADPVRFYAKTTVTIEYPGMTAIVVTCSNESYAGKLVESVSGATVSAAANIVTITLDAAADSFLITLAAQVRVNEISVYAGAAPEAPVVVTELNIDEHMDASKWTFNGENAAIENGQLKINAIGGSTAAMLNESAQNASFKFTLTIDKLADDCYDNWWGSEMIIIARSSVAGGGWEDGAQTGYTLAAWGDMTEWFIGRAGKDDLYGKFILNINDGQPHSIELKTVNNADNTTVTVTVLVDGEQAAEFVDDGTIVREGRPNLYPNGGNFTIRATNVNVSVGAAAPAEPEIVPISTALAAAEGEFKVQGVVTCIDGKNVYIQDATGAIDLYLSAAPEGLKIGDTVIGKGERTTYNGLPELKNATYELSSGMTLEAKEVTIDQLTAADICTYVKLTNLEITEVFDNNGAYSAPNLTVKDANGNTIQLYKAHVNKNDDGTWAWNVGDKIDVVCAVGVYKETLQLRTSAADDITAHVEEPVGESKTISINGAELTVEAGKWLYNTAVDAATAPSYGMLIYDKNYDGEVKTNGWGCAIVLDQYGALTEIYAGAYSQYWTAEGQAASAHFDANTYASVAWADLQDGEILIIFPNDGGNNVSRNWALDLRGLKGTNYFGEIATLEGFTFETAPVEPPVEPGNPDTGDAFGIIVAMMAISGTALLVLKKKEN